MTNQVSSNSFRKIYNIDRTYKLSRMLGITMVILLIILFLPWTQNIRTTGKVTTLRQEQRAQQLNTTISGRIVKWYVREGDMVKAGDTIAHIAEVKEDYLDPQLLERTQEQLNAKKRSVELYQGKSEAQQKQYENLSAALTLKSEQLINKRKQQTLKVQSDEATLRAVQNDLQIARKQYDRQKELYDKGLVSLTQLEQRSVALQNLEARRISAENNLNNSKQELDIIDLEQQSVRQDYMEKMNKTQGEILQALSQAATGQGEASKLQNQYASYRSRSSFYYIIAPQAGQVVQARRNGVGEIVKEGESIAQIVPPKADMAVELFIRPLDVPLVSPGQKVRFVFDGFPAIVFSGWPQASYGTFGGIVTTVENNLSPEGYYRILVREDTTIKKWPESLKLGTGTQAIALLKDVPIWYEIWRNINGFPSDFYTPNTNEKKESKK